jgi:hypothetical protein
MASFRSWRCTARPKGQRPRSRSSVGGPLCEARTPPGYPIELWQPNLFRNTTQIDPFDGKLGWNLITGMADDAIDYVTRIHQMDPSSRSSMRPCHTARRAMSNCGHGHWPK